MYSATFAKQQIGWQLTRSKDSKSIIYHNKLG